MSRNAHHCKEILRTRVTCNTAAFNEALNFILKRSNNMGFWKRSRNSHVGKRERERGKGKGQRSKEEVEAVLVEYIIDLNRK
jgi:hypothetical protein